MKIKVGSCLLFSVLFVGLNVHAWSLWRKSPDNLLSNAIRSHDVVAAEEAIKDGADLNKTRRITTGRPICMPYYVNVDYLMGAAYEGDIDFVGLYLKHKADPNKANDLGMTALYFASSLPSWDINLGMTPHMRHDQIHTRSNLRDSRRWRAAGDVLHKASSFLEEHRLPRKLQVVKQLIKHGAHIDAKDYRGMTPRWLQSQEV